MTSIDRSTDVMPVICMGWMSPVTPRIIRMLNTLDPKTFPIAMPLCPLRAETMLVASSGSEVPPATMVRPMTASLMPSEEANAEALSTKMLLPKMRHTSPRRM